MKLPEMPYQSGYQKSVQTTFGGYNHTEGAGDGEIYDMKNMTSDHYPLLASRSPRYGKEVITAGNGLIYIGDEYYRVSGTVLYHNDRQIGTVADSSKQFAAMRYYLVIYPDKVAVRLGMKGYYDYLGHLNDEMDAPEINDRYVVGTMVYYWDGTVWKVEKGYYADLATLTAAVTAPVLNDRYVVGSKLYYWDGAKWAEGGSVTEPKGYYADLTTLTASVTEASQNDRYVVGAKVYYWDGEGWTILGNEVENLESTWSGALSFLAVGEYAGVVAYDNTLSSAITNWADYFRVGDDVTISGCTVHEENNMEIIIREVDGHYLRFYENSFVLDVIPTHDITDDYEFQYGDAGMSWFMITDTEYILCELGEINSAYYLTKSSDTFSWRYIKKNCKIYYTDEKAYIKNEWGSKQEISISLHAQRLSANTCVDDQYYSEEVTIGNLDDIMLETSETLLNKFLLHTHVNYDSNEESSGFIDYDIRGKKGILSTITQYGPSDIEMTFVANFKSSDGTIDVDLLWNSPYLTEGTFDTVNVSKNIAETAVTLKRSVPDLDLIMAHDNRLWGCKDDTIYASKPGDPFNFNVFDGLSTDSYAVQSGSPEDFTAVYSYLGYPIFFKENHIYRIYGDTASEFTIYDAATRGVAAGSGASLAMANETLYYMSKTGVMAYTGGTPSLVSASWGLNRYQNGIGGSDGNKYYLDLVDGAEHRLFVYDPLRNMWHIESSPEIKTFFFAEGETWFLDKEGKRWTLSALTQPAVTEAETQFKWEVEFADITYESPNKKTLAKIQIRCEVEGDIYAYIQFDGGGDNWQQCYYSTSMNKQSKVIPIIPMRTDHFKIKLTGTGSVKINSLAMAYKSGSDQ